MSDALITIRNIDDASLWDSFVSRSSHGTIFSTSAWLSSAANAYGGIPVTLGVYDGDTLVAGVSFVEISRGGLKKATTPILTPYSGFLYAETFGVKGVESEEIYLSYAEQLITFLMNNYQHVFLVHAPTLMDIRPFLWKQWKGSVRYTYHLDITNPPNLLEQFKERTTRKISKAEDSLTLSDSYDIEFLSTMNDNLYRGKEKIPPVTRTRFVSLIKNFIASGLIDIKTATNQQGDTIAFLVIVRGRDTVYTWLYGSIHTKESTGADAYLIWDAIQRYSSTYRILDLVGANTPSIVFFKQGFCGTLIPYYVTDYYSSIVSKTAMRTYTLLRKSMQW